VHDFFEPQPITDASVFFLRFVTHDWPDSYAKRILKRLRAAAQPSTKLIICDIVVPYAAPSNEQFTDIPGSGLAPAPYPLLPNLGTVSNRAVMGDLQVSTPPKKFEFRSQQVTYAFPDDGCGKRARTHDWTVCKSCERHRLATRVNQPQSRECGGSLDFQSHHGATTPMFMPASSHRPSCPSALISYFANVPIPSSDPRMKKFVILDSLVVS